jgi:hypothetical protein
MDATVQGTGSGDGGGNGGGDECVPNPAGRGC